MSALLKIVQYLADMSSKSANYCCSFISGGEALLLLCEAELGQPMQILTDASYTAGEDALSKGMYSTWGRGDTGPKGWKDAGCVHPSLAGVSMVGFHPRPCDMSSLLTVLLSRTRRRSLVRPMCRMPCCSTTSTSATTSPKFASATFFV